MKSLKRTLSLVLALVMVLGLFGGLSINAAAATEDFTDGEKVQYVEAVDVLTGIGAIDGFRESEGVYTFRPTDTIRRADAAKLIVYATLGKEAAERLPSGVTCRYSDVDENWAWAAPSIEYLAEAGVIDGMGDGTFHPGDPINGYAIVKMLLCSIGYGANDEFVGPGWDLQVAIYGSVNKTGILADRVPGANKLEDAATREEVALYCLNAIQAPMVKWSDTLGGYYTETLKGTLADNTPKTIKNSIYGAGNGNLTKSTYVPNGVPGDGSGKTDPFGRPATEWTYKGQVISLIAETPVLTYNTSVKRGDLEKDIYNKGYKLDPTYDYLQIVENNNAYASNIDTTNTAMATYTTGVTNDEYVSAVNASVHAYNIAQKFYDGTITGAAGDGLYNATAVAPYGAGVKTEVFVNDIGTVEAIVVTYQTLSYVKEVDPDGAFFYIEDPLGRTDYAKNGIKVDATSVGFRGVCKAASALVAAEEDCPVLVTLNCDHDTYSTHPVIAVSIPNTVEGKIINTAKVVNEDPANMSFLGTVVSYALKGGETMYAAAGAPQGVPTAHHKDAVADNVDGTDLTSFETDPILGDHYGLVNTKGSGEVKFITDENGFVMSVIPSDKVPPTVGLLLAADWEDDLFGDVHWYAKVLPLTEDAEPLKLEIATTNFKNGEAKDPNKDGEDAAETTWRDIFNARIGTLVSYSAVSGDEGLFTVNDLDDKIFSNGPGNSYADPAVAGIQNREEGHDGNGIKVTKNRASVTEKGNTSEIFVADDNTTFLVITPKAGNFKGWTDWTAKLTTGIKSIETVSSDCYSVLATKGAGHLAEVIAVVNPADTTADAKLGVMVVREERKNIGTSNEYYDAVLIEGDTKTPVTIETSVYDSLFDVQSAGYSMVDLLATTTPGFGASTVAGTVTVGWENGEVKADGTSAITAANLQDTNANLTVTETWTADGIAAVQKFINDAKLITKTGSETTAEPLYIKKTGNNLTLHIGTTTAGTTPSAAIATSVEPFNGVSAASGVAAASPYEYHFTMDGQAVSATNKLVGTISITITNDDTGIAAAAFNTDRNCKLTFKAGVAPANIKTGSLDYTGAGGNDTNLEKAAIKYGRTGAVEIKKSSDGKVALYAGGNRISKEMAYKPDQTPILFEAIDSTDKLLNFTPPAVTLDNLGTIDTGLDHTAREIPKSTVIVLQDWTIKDSKVTTAKLWKEGVYNTKMVIDAGYVMAKDSAEVITLAGLDKTTRSFTHSDEVKVWNIDMGEKTVSNMVTEGKFGSIAKSADDKDTSAPEYTEAAIWIRNLNDTKYDQTINSIFVLKNIWDTSTPTDGAAGDALENFYGAHEYAAVASDHDDYARYTALTTGEVAGVKALP